MSAITGICECLAISGSASASSCEGHATRTMSQPAAVSSAICCSVVLTSAVSVVHIDCTEIGKSLPTPTLPTLICRVLRRGASTGGGGAGIPRGTVFRDWSLGSLMSISYCRLREPHRRHDVGVDQHHTQQQDHRCHHIGHRQQLCRDRKSTRLNSSHPSISYAVFCLK